MDNLDGSDHYSKTTDEPTPSLLTIILDTHPAAWSLLSPTLPLSTALAHILVFINAHLACNNSNEVCIIAAHPHCAEFLYPSPQTTTTSPEPSTNGHGPGTTETSDKDDGGEEGGQDSANTYRPFRLIQRTLLHSLTHLLATTTPSSLSTPTVALSGALTLALTYTNHLLTSLSTTKTSSTTTSTSTTIDNNPPTSTTGILNARILLISLTGNLSAQYIPLTNSIFACSRLGIPISVAKISTPSSSSSSTTTTTAPTPQTTTTKAEEDATFLQQASDTTHGTYLPIHHPHGLLQYLMLAFLPDQSTLPHLTPGLGEQGVDFRAACFCHRRVVDVGFVCSVCLSIFCEPPPDGGKEGDGEGEGEGGSVCLTCGTRLRVGRYGRKPVLVVGGGGRAKKKKRRNRVGDANGGGDGGSGAGTPVR
ncbi:MAG: hypothetical protein LQ350_005562 [Teloschistes chrysophthalmus]|nr:MAG: hypothetical protein LQ350_005562 [Niorma chrysophthalma]